jgi:photosystem II stability/assembly factor-like uncharacterized protein
MPQSEYAPNNAQTIRRGTGSDFAKNNSSFVIVVTDTGSGGPTALFSATDGGVSNTWSAVATAPQSTADAGSIAVMDSTHWIYADWAGGSSSSIYVTANGGSSWTQNPSSLPSTGWRYNPYVSVHPIAADCVTAGTACGAVGDIGGGKYGGRIATPPGCREVLSTIAAMT